MPFETISLDKLVTLDADGRMTRIHPLARDDFEKFVGRNPDHIAKLNQIYEAYTGKTPVDARRATARWLERFNIPKSDPRYQAEFDRLIEQGASNRAVLAEARRMGERQELLTLTDGELEVNVVYIAEGDAPCPECLALGGTEGPLSMFMEENLMPGSRCLGGDNCKCQLVVIENRPS
jgi:hypothetical protein